MKRHWFGPGLALLVIAIVSQGVHDVAIEHLGVPYPTLVSSPAWLATADVIVRIMFLVVLCNIIRPFLNRCSLPSAGVSSG